MIQQTYLCRYNHEFLGYNKFSIVFRDVIGPNGLNSDSEMSYFMAYVVLKKMYPLFYSYSFSHNCVWEKCFLRPSDSEVVIPWFGHYVK